MAGAMLRPFRFRAANDAILSLLTDAFTKLNKILKTESSAKTEVRTALCASICIKIRG
jgi:hypothetical protein